jgi:hypothetical protein
MVVLDSILELQGGVFVDNFQDFTHHTFMTISFLGIR